LASRQAAPVSSRSLQSQQLSDEFCSSSFHSLPESISQSPCNSDDEAEDMSIMRVEDDEPFSVCQVQKDFASQDCFFVNNLLC
jgi:hypothetical protein